MDSLELEKLQFELNPAFVLSPIDSFKPPQRSVDKPFRLCVSDVFKGKCCLFHACLCFPVLRGCLTVTLLQTL